MHLSCVSGIALIACVQYAWGFAPSHQLSKLDSRSKVARLDPLSVSNNVRATADKVFADASIVHAETPLVDFDGSRSKKDRCCYWSWIDVWRWAHPRHFLGKSSRGKEQRRARHTLRPQVPGAKPSNSALDSLTQSLLSTRCDHRARAAQEVPFKTVASGHPAAAPWPRMPELVGASTPADGIPSRFRCALRRGDRTASRAHRARHAALGIRVAAAAGRAPHAVRCRDAPAPAPPRHCRGAGSPSPAPLP